MFASINWIKDYIDGDFTDIKKFTDAMTLTGTKVEGYSYRAGSVNNVVTAKVLEIESHPDSDHMFVCKVDDGKAISQVVTGAQNVKKNDIVPFARNNSTVIDDKEIKTTKLRGILSEGMLCSAKELGIDPSCTPKNAANGIFILPEETPLGVDIKEYFELNDYVVEFELTNNRQDCNSILGICYEVGATFDKNFKYPNYLITTEGSEINKYLNVDVQDKELCKRYTARVVKVNKIEPSPQWMQNRLMSAGIRPINNIVDVSNFVMYETGQPLHTFDYDKLSGGKIIVKRADDNEKVITLDGIERSLDSNILTINDDQRCIAIAGVMGAENSDIDDNTKMVVIESANFDKNEIRYAQKKLGLRSESSAHFEKGISVNLTRYACDRAAALLIEISACELVDGLIDVNISKPEEEKTLSIDIDWFNKFVGIEITCEEACVLLERLDFSPETKEGRVFVKVQQFRQDIACEEDLAEELARMYGYEKLPMTLMPSSSYVALPNTEFAFQNKVKDILCAAGGYETLSYSFISPRDIENLGLDKDDRRASFEKIVNAYGEDYSAMRTTLVCNLINTIAANINKNNKSVLLYEIANVYYKRKENEELPEQIKKIAFGRTNSSFYYIKSIADYIMQSVKITNTCYERAKEPFLHPGKSAYILVNNENIGFIGQIHPDYAKKCEVDEKTCIAEIDFEKIYKIVQNIDVRYAPSSKYPSVSRDLALVMDEDIMSGQVEEIIRKTGGKYLISCKVFDVYRNEDVIGKGKKSIAYSLEFRSDEATLTDEIINSDIDKILRELELTLNVLLRK